MRSSFAYNLAIIVALHTKLAVAAVIDFARSVDVDNGFVCPTEDIINTQCLGPKDCLYPNPNRCDQFIHCEVNAGSVSGRPTVKDCPAGLEWNDSEKICDWPVNSTCPNTEQESKDTAKEAVPPPDSIPDSSFSCSEAEQAQGCMGQSGAGPECIYTNPKSNGSYIQCNKGGVAYIVRCKPAQFYNDAINACE